MLIPNGDRRYRSQSGRVIHKKHVSVGHNYIMRELVLCYNFGNSLRMDLTFRLLRGPGQNIAQTFMVIDLAGNRSEFRIA